MTLTIQPAHAKHFEYLVLPADQSEALRAFLAPGYADVLVQSGPAFGAWRSGICVALAGVSSPPMWGNRGEAWFVADHRCTRADLLQIVRAMKRMVEVLPYKRVDMLVDARNLTGARLALAVGFMYECTLEAYAPNGHDAYMFKRVRKS